VLDIPLWPFENREQFIRDRITAHSDATFAQETDEELPECTPKDMWQRNDSFAVKKEGNVRAKSVHETISDALAALQEAELAAKKNEKFFIESRKGERIRCESYCQVSKFCSQYQRYKSGNIDV
jgi:hypothetical protein